MTFNDIFKSSFLENVTSVSIFDMLIAMILAFAIGMFIFLVYKKTYQGVMYSSSFGVTLVALTMISTLVILAVTSSVFILVHSGRYSTCCRDHPASGIRKYHNRRYTYCFCQ